MKHLLDNIVWHSLTGPHAKYAVGNEEARRYEADLDRGTREIRRSMSRLRREGSGSPAG